MIRTKEPAGRRAKPQMAGKGPGRPKGRGKAKASGRARGEAPGHNSPISKADAFVRRLENLEADKAEAVAELRVQYAADAKEVLSEAKAAGLLPKMLKVELAIRKLTRRRQAIANGLEVGERDQLRMLHEAHPHQIELQFGPEPKKKAANGAAKPKAETSAFQRGFEAAVAGAGPEDNPFSRGDKHGEWIDGYTKASEGTAKPPKAPRPSITDAAT